MDWAEEKYDVSVVYMYIHTIKCLYCHQNSSVVIKIPIFLFVWLQKLLIAQVKMVVKVLFLYIPLPMFWALFDQQVTIRSLLNTGCLPL